MKAYVLLALGYQYNDENYYRTENDDGRPVKVFFNESDAVAAVADVLLAQVRKAEQGIYGYDVFDLLHYYDRDSGDTFQYLNPKMDEAEFRDHWKAITGEECELDESGYEFCIRTKKYTDEQLREIFTLCSGMKLYEVVEVDADELPQ